MNTVVLLDINTFKDAEREAANLRISVPEFCSMAIQEYVKSKNKSAITQQLDAFYSAHIAKLDEDILQAQYDSLDEEDW